MNMTIIETLVNKLTPEEKVALISQLQNTPSQEDRDNWKTEYKNIQTGIKQLASKISSLKDELVVNCKFTIKTKVTESKDDIIYDINNNYISLPVSVSIITSCDNKEFKRIIDNMLMDIEDEIQDRLHEVFSKFSTEVVKLTNQATEYGDKIETAKDKGLM